MNLTPINEIQLNRIYFTHTRNYPVQVMSLSRYGHNCTIPMVTYMVLCATGDAKAGQLFTLEESLFLKKMKEIDFDYSAIDFEALPTALKCFADRLDQNKLEILAGSIEVFKEQKLGKLPITKGQVAYISNTTLTPKSSWCGLSTFLSFGRGYTVLAYKTQAAIFNKLHENIR